MAFDTRLLDARGNEIRSAFPDTVTNETVTDPRPITAVLASLNAEVVMDLNGAQTASFDVRTAAGNLTYVFEGTIDGVNYMPMPAFAVFQALASALVAEQYVPSVVVATTHSGIYTVGCSGFRRVRLRVSAYTSGNITVASRASVADLLIYAKLLPSTLHVTVTAAVNVGITITLPAAGVGLFHYITAIHITRSCNATATAAGAALVITSTNLPGTPAWTVGNATIAGESKLDLNYSPTTPLKSLVANTATTIVAPVPGAGVIWRGNCSYYVGA
jgi:hypothetical protein